MSVAPLLRPALPTSAVATSTLPASTGATVSSASTGTAALAVALAVQPDFWEPLVRFREGSRWTALLDADHVRDTLAPSLHAELADAQIWLLSWLAGQGTPLHDHGRSSGAFVVARGTLTERVVAGARETAPRVTETELSGGRLRYFGPHYVHRVTNRHPEPAVSLHVYAPRLTEMNTYRVDDGRLVRTGTERAGVDW